MNKDSCKRSLNELQPARDFPRTQGRRKKLKRAEHLQGVRKKRRQSSSMRLLVVFALLFCIVACVDQARAEMQAMKLCGRELMRAVTYTCGGSRWRRFFSEPDMGGLPAREPNSLENISTPGSDWSKRDINNILTTVCCQVGCRKSELAYLC